MIFAFIYLIIKVQEGEDMIKLAVIADDLTGANDTALQFAKRNIKSSVEINFMKMEDVEDKEVIVVDTDSRDLDKELSYKKVKDICEKISKYDIKCIYKKADSMGMTAKRGKEMDSLGMVVKGFKLGCNRAYRRIYGMKKMNGCRRPGHSSQTCLPSANKP